MAHAAGAVVTFTTGIMDLSILEPHMVVSIALQQPGGLSDPVFLRKVLTRYEYEAGNIALLFSTLRVAVSNLNGQGDFGSLIVGGIAPRWA